MAKCDIHPDVDIAHSSGTIYGYTCTNCGTEISGGGRVDKGPTLTAYCYKCSKDFTDKKTANRASRTVYYTYCPQCTFGRV